MEQLIDDLVNSSPQFATWFIAGLIILNIFKQPLAAFLFSKFPSMAEGHFAAIANDKSDRREFEQRRDMELLKAQLADSEANRRQQLERERTYFAIIDNSLQFAQHVVISRIDSNNTEIITEIGRLKTSIDRLAKQLRGDDTTQSMILERIK